jgi:hypothetical protein
MQGPIKDGVREEYAGWVKVFLEKAEFYLNLLIYPF